MDRTAADAQRLKTQAAELNMSSARVSRTTLRAGWTRLRQLLYHCAIPIGRTTVTVLIKSGTPPPRLGVRSAAAQQVTSALGGSAQGARLGDSSS